MGVRLRQLTEPRKPMSRARVSVAGWRRRATKCFSRLALANIWRSDLNLKSLLPLRLPHLCISASLHLPTSRIQSASDDPLHLQAHHQAEVRMNSKGAVLLQSTNYALLYAQHTSLLPFLYQTRTLQRLREKRKPAGSQSCNAFSTSSSFRAVSDDILFEEFGASAGPMSGQPSKVRLVGVGPRQTLLSKAQGRAPPTMQELRESLFSSPFPDTFQESPPTARQPRESTITAAEHAVFSRIFADLGAKDDPNAALEDDSLNDELEANSDPDANLDRIFEAAIRMSRPGQSDPTAETEDDSSKAKKRVRPGSALMFVDSFDLAPGSKDVLSRYPSSLREAAARADKARMTQGAYAYRTVGAGPDPDDEPTDTFDHLEDEDTEYGRKVYRARMDDRIKVESMLDHAETDVEIWRVLEDEVFSIVAKFQEQLEAEEHENDRAAKKAARKKKKGRIDAQVTEAEVPPATEKPDEQVPLLAILETNYAAHCLHALRLLRKHFRNSLYALSLLPKIKSLGPISYVLGTSSDLYNELMFIKWREYSDLHGISELGTEMRNRGLAVNQMTLEVLRAVLLMSKQGAKGKYGEVVMAWWGLQGSVAGVAKVSGLYGRLWSDYLEKRRRAPPGQGGWWELDERGRVEERTPATPGGP